VRSSASSAPRRGLEPGDDTAHLGFPGRERGLLALGGGHLIGGAAGVGLKPAKLRLGRCCVLTERGKPPLLAGRGVAELGEATLSGRDLGAQRGAALFERAERGFRLLLLLRQAGDRRLGGGNTLLAFGQGGLCRRDAPLDVGKPRLGLLQRGSTGGEFGLDPLGVGAQAAKPLLGGRDVLPAGVARALGVGNLQPQACKPPFLRGSVSAECGEAGFAGRGLRAELGEALLRRRPFGAQRAEPRVLALSLGA
jgi:hypothetical protein